MIGSEDYKHISSCILKNNLNIDISIFKMSIEIIQNDITQIKNELENVNHKLNEILSNNLISAMKV